MHAITLNKVNYSIDGRDILTQVTQQIKIGERIGIIGANGVGKTTLAHLMIGDLSPDSGEISINGRVIYVPQLVVDDSDRSGGEKMMQRINESLNNQPDILVLDEPTANLDMTHQNWLIKRLSHFYGTLIVISHDSYFLNHIIQKIWALHEQQVTAYNGNYHGYLAQRNLANETQNHLYHDAVNKKKQLQRAMTKVKVREGRATKLPKNISPSDARLGSGKSKALKAQKKLGQNAKTMARRFSELEKVDKPLVTKPLKLQTVAGQNYKTRTILKITGETVKAGNRLLLQDVNFNLETGERLAVLGDNGSGKTTLIKQIIKNYDKPVGYFSQNLSGLDEEKTVLENVLLKSSQLPQLARDFLGAFGIKRDMAFQKVSSLSGGEKVKVLLLQVLFTDTQLLILDEPTNYLDLLALDALTNFLTHYAGAVLIVSHYKDFIDAVATKKMRIQFQHLLPV